jgi:hypothetical protein
VNEANGREFKAKGYGLSLLFCGISNPLREARMRALTCLLLSGLAFAAVPAQAQTYDPNYPVCLQTYGINGNYIACGYTSMAQCKLSASARAAQCIDNPYFGFGKRRR